MDYADFALDDWWAIDTAENPPPQKKSVIMTLLIQKTIEIKTVDGYAEVAAAITKLENLGWSVTVEDIT